MCLEVFAIPKAPQKVFLPASLETSWTSPSISTKRASARGPESRTWRVAVSDVTRSETVGVTWNGSPRCACAPRRALYWCMICRKGHEIEVQKAGQGIPKVGRDRRLFVVLLPTPAQNMWISAGSLQLRWCIQGWDELSPCYNWDLVHQNGHAKTLDSMVHKAR